MRIATERAHEVIDVERCSVLTVNPKSGMFHLKALSGKTLNVDVGLRGGEGIAGEALKKGLPVMANEPESRPGFVKTGGPPVSSLLCLPLRIAGGGGWVLNLANKTDGKFTDGDGELAVRMCALVEESVENSRLLKEKINDEKLDAVGRMAAGIIHDIKNPITAIRGFAALLGDMDFTEEERRRYGGIIIKEADRLLGLVEDLLALSKGFKGGLEMEERSAAEFFGEIVPLIERDLSERKIEVVKALGYDGSLKIDAGKFKRAVLGIVKNAKEAVHDGGRILILTRTAPEGLVEMVFSDTGAGIPPEIIEGVFEPFVSMGKKSGTGLGLAVVKKIIEGHGGSIRASNGNYSGLEGFDGANFIIKLPLA